MGGQSHTASRYRSDLGPNVERIMVQASLVVRGRIPLQVRKELLAAVKVGALGRLKKDGLKPEVFYHPDHRNGAIERQSREATYSIGCIAQVMAVIPVEDRINAAIAKATGEGAK